MGPSASMACFCYFFIFTFFSLVRGIFLSSLFVSFCSSVICGASGVCAMGLTLFFLGRLGFLFSFHLVGQTLMTLDSLLYMDSR